MFYNITFYNYYFVINLQKGPIYSKEIMKRLIKQQTIYSENHDWLGILGGSIVNYDVDLHYH